MSEIRTEVVDGVGRIRLDRPKAINALSTQMCADIHAALDAWRDDDAVTSVEISGEGERGFCSGGDVRAVRQHVVDGDPDQGMAFFETEYAMDLAIAEYPKPFRALMHGITMGGGLGVSAHGSDRIVFPDAKIAMPETIIGFFPDVGICWLLARTPSQWGVHMALTGDTVNAADAVKVGLADRGPDGATLPEPTLVDAVWVDECYAGNDAAAILARLEAHPTTAARAAAAAIRQRSPLSVCVSLEAIRRAGEMASVAEVLEQDLRLARASLTNPDFLEGVRAQLVDKDRTPSWRHARVEDVTRAEVEAMFAYGA